LNFNCVFPSCSFKRNDIEEEEEEVLKPLNEEHQNKIRSFQYLSDKTGQSVEHRIAIYSMP